jgi:glycosyltransferase involved in cell wall biosynthesis
VREPKPRVAFFACTYHEVDGVARTSRQFESFAQQHEIPVLLVHAGPADSITSEGSVTRVQLRRCRIKLTLDDAHHYDLLFFRWLSKVRELVEAFQPDLVQITGPSDIGAVGALVAHQLGIPLAACWQTNLDQYARSRAAALTSFLPASLESSLLSAIQRLSFRACARFYKIPRLLFAPNQEMMQRLEEATGKPCLLMGHAVDTAAFSPAFRTRNGGGGVLRIGYAGRLTAEKNVSMLVRLDQALRARGHENFQMVVIGQGPREKWLRRQLPRAEFTGVLGGAELSRAFANLDILAFPSETDTFGLVVLEALASGVPAVVTAKGGPKFVVRDGRTGFVAGTFEEFVSCTAILLRQPELLGAMRAAARQQALGTSWDKIFECMYDAYESRLLAAPMVRPPVLSTAMN